MNLQIIGANFGRTGTFSLKSALEQLDLGPCLHMSKFVADGDLCRNWLAEINSDNPDWEGLFTGYRAVVDWPGCLFVEALLARAPEARVIYTERDFDCWYRSVSDTIFPALHWSRHIAPERRPAFITFAEEIVGRRTFAGNFDRATAQQLYKQHREYIFDLVPTTQLLVFNVQMGWSPLCRFLGVPEPATDFPKENASGEFFGNLSQIRRGRSRGG